MKMLCIIGLMVVLAFFFLGALPLMFSVIVHTDDDFEASYTLGLITTMVIVIVIISSVTINFYYTPEFFGYQKIVSENGIESEE